MPKISKEENEIHNSIKKSQAKILDKMAQIEMDIHKHHSMHGGDIDIVGAFKNLGNTIKSGFEDKIINPIKSGFEDKIINPIENKIINPVQEKINSLPKKTQDLINKIPQSVKDSPEFQKTLDFITKKKGGLASSLLHNGLPAFTSAVGGATATLLAPEFGPLSGVAGSTAGGYAGKELSDYIGNKTGVGLKRKLKGKGMSRDAYNTTVEKMKNQIDNDAWKRGQEKIKTLYGKVIDDNKTTPAEWKSFTDYKAKVDKKHKERLGMSGGKIKKHKSKKYYSSSDSSSDSEEEYKRTRPNKNALQQLIEGHREQEAKEIKKGQAMLTRHQVEEMKFLRQGIPLEHVGDYPLAPKRPRGYGIKKIVGTKRGNKARGDIVAEVMKKQGLSLGEASKYVSKHNLY